MPKLTCLKQHKTYEIRAGTELLRAYQINPSLPFKFGCCEGNCGVCAIRVIEGNENLSRPTKKEKETLQAMQLDSSHRLACQCAILGNVSIDK